MEVGIFNLKKLKTRIFATRGFPTLLRFPTFHSQKWRKFQTRNVTCGGGHNGGGKSIDGGVGSREGPGVEAAHGGDVGGGGVGGDAGQLESGLAADQAGGERGVRLKVRRVTAWI